MSALSQLSAMFERLEVQAAIRLYRRKLDVRGDEETRRRLDRLCLDLMEERMEEVSA